MIKKYFINYKEMFNLVCFLSEGPPNDKGLNLTKNKDILIKKAFPHFDNINIYTPKILKNMKLDNYIKEYKHKGLVSQNPGLHKIGFCAWRPKIILLELEKMQDGDILIYRDCNILKYPILGNYNNIKNKAIEILEKINFDFFIPRANKVFKLKQFTKTNIIRELGENHPFVYEFPNLCSGLFTIIRKSNVSIELLKEWENACLKDEWINGLKYGDLHPQFKWSCPEQSILCVIIANWIIKKKHNIPNKYPFIGFIDRDIDKMFFYDDKNDYDYLNILINNN